ncbi:hypothetical protein CBR_g21236 [Chara braunii]|uniref:Uncharacterized protein n=1 Tax=Chara braunii TaxID=69332 RepID=A0A388L123_CHABU|nr:hypothetical protein CBR_g21236 [Chara braunii]|eukprot:GBG75995.1 hypothetical protein CBR_g21236 [Chara braunii]
MGAFAGVVDATCGALLRELQHIWDELGESDADRDRMLLKLEQECLDVYRRKVDEANRQRISIQQAVADGEAEVMAICGALGERYEPLEGRVGKEPLKQQLAAVKPRLEKLRAKRDLRVREFTEVQIHVARITAELSGGIPPVEIEPIGQAELDLTANMLEELQQKLQDLQREKSSRLDKVLEHVQMVHDLCSVLGLDFTDTVMSIHPSLDGTSTNKSVSSETLELLAKTVQDLKEEKTRRMQKLSELGATMVELWSLLDIPECEQQPFMSIAMNIAMNETEMVHPGAVSVDVLKAAELEVQRLEAVKQGKMKELVSKKRRELDEICAKSHIIPPENTCEERTSAIIQAGVVDPSELLSTIEEQIFHAKEEVASRAAVLSLMEKWKNACEEEKWLEEYNKDENRYTASRGSHLQLKRAERARAMVGKIPQWVENLTKAVKQWEEDHSRVFLYDGERVLNMMEDYRNKVRTLEAEKRRLRDQKKLQEAQATEQEMLFGTSSPNRSLQKQKRIQRAGSVGSQAGRRLSMGGAMLLTSPHSLDAGNSIRNLGIGVCGGGSAVLGAQTPARPGTAGREGRSTTPASRARPVAPVNYVALANNPPPATFVQSAAADSIASGNGVAGKKIGGRGERGMSMTPVALNRLFSEDGEVPSPRRLPLTSYNIHVDENGVTAGGLLINGGGSLLGNSPSKGSSLKIDGSNVISVSPSSALAGENNPSAISSRLVEDRKTTLAAHADSRHHSVNWYGGVN